MGMFDSVIIDTDKLPVSDEEKKLIGSSPDWQSKTFDCILTEIYITNKDELKINRWDYETVPPDDRPYPDKDNPMHFVGSQRRVNEKLETINYNGILNFYCDIKTYWYEFYAEFNNGKLINIEGGKDNYLDSI